MGNQGSFVQDTGLATLLSSFGLEPEWIWSGAAARPMSLVKRIPEDCEAIVLLFEMQHEGHTILPIVRDICTERRIPFIALSHKKARAATTLRQLGYTQRNVQLESSPMPQEKHTVAVAAVPVLREDAAFAQHIDDLRALLRVLRDEHHVITITFDKDAGLEVIRRQSLVVDV